MAHVQIFLSTVSAELRSYRDALRRDLDRPNVTVKVQGDFTGWPPNPIPESLLEVPVPELDAPEADPFGALAEL